jgi:hypothetical protein
MAWLEVLGWTGSAVLVWSLLQTRVLWLRALNLLASILLVAYNYALDVWPMVAMNAAIAGINVWHLSRLVGTRHDEAAYEVVEVAPDDAYLRHVLRRHEADIRRYTPDLRWNGAAPGRLAFLVLRDTETVGVVLVRDEGDGVARVALDYVVPRFRDFTPGEFVYRRSGLLRERGFQRVVAPASMREADTYLQRVGFRREGDSRVLDL